MKAGALIDQGGRELAANICLLLMALVLAAMAWNWRASGLETLGGARGGADPAVVRAGWASTAPRQEDRRDYLALYARLLGIDAGVRLTAAPQRTLTPSWRASRIELETRVADETTALRLWTALRTAHSATIARECQLSRDAERWHLRCAVDFLFRAG